jgi:hypothetical protein
MIYQGKARTPVREAILHCAAIKTGQFNGMRPPQVFAAINQCIPNAVSKRVRLPRAFHADGEFYSGRPYLPRRHVIGHTGNAALLIERAIKESRERRRFAAGVR